MSLLSPAIDNFNSAYLGNVENVNKSVSGSTGQKVLIAFFGILQTQDFSIVCFDHDGLV